MGISEATQLPVEAVLWRPWAIRAEEDAPVRGGEPEAEPKAGAANRLVSDLSLDKAMLQELLARKFSAWAASGDRSLGTEPVRRQ